MEGFKATGAQLRPDNPSVATGGAGVTVEGAPCALSSAIGWRPPHGSICSTVPRSHRRRQTPGAGTCLSGTLIHFGAKLLSSHALRDRAKTKT